MAVSSPPALAEAVEVALVGGWLESRLQRVLVHVEAQHLVDGDAAGVPPRVGGPPVANDLDRILLRIEHGVGALPLPQAARLQGVRLLSQLPARASDLVSPFVALQLRVEASANGSGLGRSVRLRAVHIVAAEERTGVSLLGTVEDSLMSAVLGFRPRHLRKNPMRVSACNRNDLSLFAALFAATSQAPDPVQVPD